MKNFYLTIVVLSFALWGQAQNYSYSFSGLLSLEQREKIERELNELSGIQEAKLKYKEDRERGEFILTIVDLSGAEGVDQFSATSMKDLLLSYGLEPKDFIELK